MSKTSIAKSSAALGRITGVLALAVAVLASGGGCARRGETSAESPNTPLAEVDGKKITVADLDKKLETVPRLVRAEFTGETGRSRMVQRMVEEEMLLRAAKAEGIESDSAVRAKLESSRRELLIQAFLDKKQREASQVTDEEVRAFYDAHPEEYTLEPALRMRLLVMKDRVRIDRVREMIAKGTIRFEEAVGKYCDDPEIVDAQGLVPEWVRNGRAVQWIGNHPNFHEVVFALPLGEISPVIETPSGLILARVEEKREASVRPFEEARADVEARLIREKSAEALPRVLEDLKKRYRVKIFEPEGKSAEELFSEAQGQSDPNERIRLYQEILARHPDDPHAVEALFMIGFIQSEELGDRTAAKATFERVVREHPSSDLAESARWMLSDESKKPPPFDADSTREGEGSAS